jgi:GxxExxY protein
MTTLAPRFTELYTIPQSLVSPPPQGGFPATPMITFGAVSEGLDDKLKTPYSHVIYFSITRELPRRGISFDRQKPLPIVYKGTKLDCGYRVDLLAYNSVILELKSVDSLAPIQEAIVLTYLRMSGCEIGWLINFNVPVLRNGIKRLVWNYRAPEDENPSPQRRGARRAH